MDNLDFSENTKDGTTMHATTHNIYQYQTTGEELVIASVPNLNKVGQTKLSNPEKIVVPELHIGKKERKTTRSLSNVPLIQNQTVNKSIIDDVYIVWILYRLLANREGSAHDETFVEVITWNEFYESMVDEVKNQTTIGYGPMYHQPPTNSGVVQASIEYCLSLTGALGSRQQ